MRLLTRPVPLPSWTAGLMQEVEPGNAPAGAIEEGADFVPQPNGLLMNRGGSRILQSLTDAGAAAISYVQIIRPWSPTGALVIGWSDGQNEHYAWRLTADGDFASGAEATSRHDLSAAPSTAWNNGSTPARPWFVELFEKAFLVDATEVYADRNTMLSIDSSGTLVQRSFAFGSGAAQAIRPFVCEEYNNVLFIAGYGSEDANDADRPELVRHSFLGRSPDAADGFDPDAWNIIGAKGQRVTGLKKGRGILLVAKKDELHRISGFGRAYSGWCYQTDSAQNTLGFGVENPYALEFVDPYWYGIGKQGPFRTDGYHVESLRGPRQRGWAGLDNLTKSWVSYHPERRLVLFGVHETQAGGTGYPNVVWLWDLDREVWTTDWRPGVVMFYGAAVTSATASGASAAPSSPASASVGVDGWTANWTNGDATALTEYWEKLGAGGTWALQTTLGAGVSTSGALAGKQSAVDYYWKVRHKKNGVFSDFTSETLVQTTIDTPTLAAFGSDETLKVHVIVTNNADSAVDLIVERSVASAGVWSVNQTITDVPASEQREYHDTGATCGVSYDYRAKGSQAPYTDSAYSATETVPEACVVEPEP